MSGRIETKLARRRFLKGAGGAAIALPLFWGREQSVWAGTVAPERFISVYFRPGTIKCSEYAGRVNALARYWATPPAQWIGDRSPLRYPRLHQPAASPIPAPAPVTDGS